VRDHTIEEEITLVRDHLLDRTIDVAKENVELAAKNYQSVEGTFMEGEAQALVNESAGIVNILKVGQVGITALGIADKVGDTYLSYVDYQSGVIDGPTFASKLSANVAKSSLIILGARLGVPTPFVDQGVDALIAAGDSLADKAIASSIGEKAAEYWYDHVLKH
jgi:hypothetical protein